MRCLPSPRPVSSQRRRTGSPSSKLVADSCTRATGAFETNYVNAASNAIAQTFRHFLTAVRPLLPLCPSRATLLTLHVFVLQCDNVQNAVGASLFPLSLSSAGLGKDPDRLAHGPCRTLPRSSAANEGASEPPFLISSSSCSTDVPCGVMQPLAARPSTTSPSTPACVFDFSPLCRSVARADSLLFAPPRSRAGPGQPVHGRALHGLTPPPRRHDGAAPGPPPARRAAPFGAEQLRAHA